MDEEVNRNQVLFDEKCKIFSNYPEDRLIAIYNIAQNEDKTTEEREAAKFVLRERLTKACRDAAEIYENAVHSDHDLSDDDRINLIVEISETMSGKNEVYTLARNLLERNGQSIVDIVLFQKDGHNYTIGDLLNNLINLRDSLSN